MSAGDDALRAGGQRSAGQWAALAVFLASPLAFLLGAVPLPAKAVTPPPAAPSQLTNAQSSAPSKDCARRFLAPIEELSASGRTGDAAKRSLVLEGKVEPDGALHAHSASDEPPPWNVDQWIASATEAVNNLRHALGAGESVDALIATVADPTDSGLGYQFDTSLQALRLGLEHGGPREDEDPALFRDRSWLPWRDAETSGAERAHSAECRQTTPGLMLFRGGSTTAPRVRLLLLVGETPTAGLHSTAMVNALRLTGALNRPCAVAPTKDEKPGAAPACATTIIGPTFSGGAFSLRLALGKWAKETDTRRPAPIHIVTGSATGAALPATLSAESGWPAPLQVWFEGTTVPENAVECAYLHQLKRLGAEPMPASSSEAGSNAPDLLAGVAMLHESGTEFGANSQQRTAAAGGSCDLRAAIQISFPANIASLREAYEDLDRKDGRAKETIARPTSLEVSLRESQAPLDAQARPSPKTTFARDMALVQTLTRISVEKVRHVGIHATDMADAIFLARKIRDVAPDVRLAFFEADALLLHPDFRRDLLGSLVVSPYPFLGSSHFGPGDERTYAPFENAVAEGTFNAVLATRGWRFDELWEYTLPSSSMALPIWRATIGRNGMVPLGVSPAVDCNRTIYGKGAVSTSPDLLARLCQGDKEGRASAWREFDGLSTLAVRAAVPLPRAWQFLFALLTLGFIVDQLALRRTRLSLARDAMPFAIARSTDRAADLAIGRTKWLLYAAIRTFLFTLAFLYMAIVYAFSWTATERWGVVEWLQAAVLASTLWASGRLTLRAQARFAKDYERFAVAVGKRSLIGWLYRKTRRFGRWLDSASQWALNRMGIAYLDGSGMPSSPAARDGSANEEESARAWSDGNVLDRISDAVGFTHPQSRGATARTSFAQLRLIVLLAVGLSLAFTALLLAATFEASRGWWALTNGIPVPALTLLVLRTVSLGSGVSPVAPALFCLVGVYAWATGRMARLAGAHAISRLSPDDGEDDLVSTPLAVVLYPNHDPCPPPVQANVSSTADGGFSKVERAVANAIWRPITGPMYMFAVIVVILVPLVLFALKPLATVESRWGTWLLGSGLALSATLICITLIQVVRYWLALQVVLKRTMNHRIGTALTSARPFIRESVDEQLSRSPNDLLRLAACSHQFDEILLAAGAREHAGFASDSIDGFRKLQGEIERARNDALSAASTGATASLADKSAILGQHVLQAAREVTRLLEQAWTGDPSLFWVDQEQAVAEAIPQEQAVAAGGSPEAGRLDGPDDGRSSSRASGRMRSGTQTVPSAGGVVDVAPHPIAAVQMATGANARPPARENGGKHARLPTDEDADGLSPMAWRLEPGELEWLRRCQAFVATVVALLISRYVRQFRYFLYAMTASVLVLLLALTSYPFEPHRLLLSCSWGIVGSVVGAGIWIFVELDRNTVISHIAGTAPGKLTVNGALAVRVVAWAVLPILGVAATTYPEVASALYGLVEPFVRALR
jgi:hypothetical protein